MSQNECDKIQTAFRNVGTVFSKKPRFDKNGRPVECLNWIKENPNTHEEDGDNKFYRRDRIAQRIIDNVLSRPMKRKRSSLFAMHFFICLDFFKIDQLQHAF